jgi:hypothetical protein
VGSKPSSNRPNAPSWELCGRRALVMCRIHMVQGHELLQDCTPEERYAMRMKTWWNSTTCRVPLRGRCSLLRGKGFTRQGLLKLSHLFKRFRTR